MEIDADFEDFINNTDVEQIFYVLAELQLTPGKQEALVFEEGPMRSSTAGAMIKVNSCGKTNLKITLGNNSNRETMNFVVESETERVFNFSLSEIAAKIGTTSICAIEADREIDLEFGIFECSPSWLEAYADPAS